MPPKAEKTPTEAMLGELREAEKILALLDQNSNPAGSLLGRLYTAQYAGVVKHRDEALREWNADAAYEGSAEKGILPIFRCDRAARVYHTPADGPCEIWTTNTAGDQHLCDICRRRYPRGA